VDLAEAVDWVAGRYGRRRRRRRRRRRKMKMMLVQRVDCQDQGSNSS
jgi:hypothetical protein